MCIAKAKFIGLWGKIQSEAAHWHTGATCGERSSSLCENFTKTILFDWWLVAHITTSVEITVKYITSQISITCNLLKMPLLVLVLIKRPFYCRNFTQPRLAINIIYQNVPPLRHFAHHAWLHAPSILLINEIGKAFYKSRGPHACTQWHRSTGIKQFVTRES